MAKSATGAMTTHIGLSATTLVKCFKLKRTDGVISGFTEHDVDIPNFDLDAEIAFGDGDGPVTYLAAQALGATLIKNRTGLAVNNLEAIGALESAGITIEDIRGGRYDNAEVKVFEVNWQDLTMGPVPLGRYHIGNMIRQEEEFIAELRGLTQKYIQEILGVFTPLCRADLGDQPGNSPSINGCKVRTDPSAWAANTPYTIRPARDAALGSVVKPSAFNDRHFKAIGFVGGSPAGTSGGSEPSWNLTIGGTTTDGDITWETIQALTIEANVSSVTSNREFGIDYTGDASEALITGGLCTFLDTISPSPNNAGLKKEVKQYSVSPPTIILFEAMPFDVQVGDPVTITAGCDKTLATCRDTFDNMDNARAEWYIPGTDLLAFTPNP